MKLTRLEDSHPWRDRAEEYRTFANAADDDLAWLGYLQLAQYCETMAVRQDKITPTSTAG
jgi:hypothetical protein